MHQVDEVRVDPGTATVTEHGWQSWSPSTTYRLGERPSRPSTENLRVLCYRPDVVAPPDAFQGEGLLAVQGGPGAPVHLFA